MIAVRAYYIVLKFKGLNFRGMVSETISLNRFHL